MNKRKKKKRATASAKKNLGKSLLVSRQKKQRWKNLRTETHQHPCRTDGLGWVYCGTLRMDSLYKIGFASDPKKREQALRATNPRYENVFAIQTNFKRSAEGIIHNALIKHNKGRELFELTYLQVEALRRTIRDMMWIDREIDEMPTTKAFRIAWKANHQEMQLANPG